MDFEKLYALVESMDNSTKEKCLICHFPIDTDELVLTCNHYYHSACLHMKSHNIKCPYCDKSVSAKQQIINKCIFIMRTGKNKGLPCNRINCKYHKINVIQEVIGCASILKSGARKGLSCNRTNCKIHNINL